MGAFIRKERNDNMFKIENKQIHLTRGNIADIKVNALNADGTDYEFKTGDVVRLNIFEKNNCGCIVLQKDVKVTDPVLTVSIDLDGTETKFGETINRPTEYWYEVELNPETAPQTIIGYDEDGAKVFTIYPEGSDKNE